MAFIANNFKKIDNNVEGPSNSTPLLSNLPVMENNSIAINLTKPEIETLLILIRSGQFKGESIQPIYDLILKLQQGYSSLT